MRNKAENFLRPKSNQQSKETFGIRSVKNAKAVPELKSFENELIDLAKTVEFKRFDNQLQRNLKRICDEIKEEPKLIIPADKTPNFYKVTLAEHDDMRQRDVQKSFKKEKKTTLNKIKKEHQKIATNLDLDDRIFETTKLECFVKLKDHKNNFREAPSVRTLNPTKPDIGKISKKILDEKINVIRQMTNLNQWQNTKAAINWFKKIKNKKKAKFILFDVEQFYPSIDEDLLEKAIIWGSNFIQFSVFFKIA